MNVRARISRDGTIAVPKSIRDAHGWVDGVELEFVDGSEGVVVQSVSDTDRDSRFPAITMDEFLRERLRIDHPFPSDEEIEKTLLDEAARRFDATRR